MIMKKLRALACAAAVTAGLLSAVPVNAVTDYAKNVQANDLKNASAFVLGTQNWADAALDVSDDGLLTVADEVIIKRVLTGEYVFETTPPPSEFEDISAKELVSRIKIGWNLGNTLDSTTTSWLKNPTVEQSETAWGNPVTTKPMIDAVKNGGFNLVRIPTSWIDHTGPGPEYKIEDAWMARVRTVVDYVMANDIYCILNIHHENDWLIPRNSNKDAVQQRLTAIWTQIANEFKDYDERLILEGMNEPRLVGDPNEWNGGTSEARTVINSYNQTFVNAVRATGGNNAKRVLMVPTYAASCSDATVKDFVLPTDTVANKLVVSIHNYSPYSFALQKQSDGGTASYSDMNSSGLKWSIDIINSSFVAKGIPIIMGEFGAMTKNNDNDRLRWANDFISLTESYGIKCVWWDNNLFNSNGENFGLLNRGTLQFQPQSLVDAMMNNLK